MSLVSEKPDRQGGHVPEAKPCKKADDHNLRCPPNGRASDTLLNRSKHSQTAHAAVREDIETHVRSFPGVHDLIEPVPRVRL